MLVLVSLVLHDVEERRVFHLQPEFAVLVFQHRFILILENTIGVTLSHNRPGERCREKNKQTRLRIYRSVSLQGHQPVIDGQNDREQALRGLALGFGLFLLPGAVAELRGGRVVVQHFVF